jgi:DNA-binding transcriptional LysR family regulator
LFVRSTRRVELTHEGQDLLRRSRDILALVDETFGETEPGSMRSLSIGLCGTIGYDLLPRMAARARGRLPQLCLTTKGEMHSRELYNELLSGSLDLALVHSPVSNPEVAAKTLREETLGVLMPADHKLANRTEIRIADIAHELFVACKDSFADEMHNHVARLCLAAGFRPTLVHVGHPLSVQAGFIASGLGVAVLPASCSHLRFIGTRFIPLVDAAPVEIAVAWRRNFSKNALPELLALVFETAESA